MSKELSMTKSAIYNRAYRLKNKEKISILQKPYQERYRKNRTNEEKNSIKEYQQKYWINNHTRRIPIKKNYFLKNKYGLTLEQYNDLFNKQNGCCAICGVHQKELKLPLCVDHCHNTNNIRGLLCSKCNSGLGFFKDNVLFLKSAIKYLNK